MKRKIKNTVNDKHANMDSNSDLEDGELPGEVAEDNAALAALLSKQRKLTHDENPGRSRWLGIDASGWPAAKLDSYKHGQHLQDRDHRERNGHRQVSGHGNGLDKQRNSLQSRYERHQPQAQQAQRRQQSNNQRDIGGHGQIDSIQHLSHQKHHHNDERPHQKQQQQEQRSRHKYTAYRGGSTASAAGATASAGAGHSNSSAADASVVHRSNAFESSKAALKARLQCLDAPELLRTDATCRASGDGGGKGQVGSVSPYRGKQMLPAASSGGTLSAGGAGGNYVASVYKEVRLNPC